MSSAPARRRCSGRAMDRATTSRVSKATARMSAMSNASLTDCRCADELSCRLCSTTASRSRDSTLRSNSIWVVLAENHCCGSMSRLTLDWRFSAACSIRVTVRTACPVTALANRPRCCSLASAWNWSTAARWRASRSAKSWNSPSAKLSRWAIPNSVARTCAVISLARERSLNARTRCASASSPPGWAISWSTSSSRPMTLPAWNRARTAPEAVPGEPRPSAPVKYSFRGDCVAAVDGAHAPGLHVWLGARLALLGGLHHLDPQTRPGEIAGAHQPVVPRADHYHIDLPGHSSPPRRAQPAEASAASTTCLASSRMRRRCPSPRKLSA